MGVRTRTILVWGLLLVAFGLRLIGAVRAAPPAKDAAEYHRLAGHMVAGRGFSADGESPTAYRPPGYPAFLAAIQAGGGGPLAVGVVESLLGALTCVLLYRLGCRLDRPATGVGAAALWAVNPLAFDSYYAAGSLNSETLASFLLLVVLHCLWVAFETPAVWRSWLAGVALGGAILTKSSLLPLPLFLMPMWLVQAWRQRSLTPIAMGVATAVGCAAVVLPWTVRNLQILGAPVVVSTNGGITFYRSNNPVSDGGHTYPAGGLDQFVDCTEVERSARLHAEGMRFLADHPEKIPWLVYRKIRLLMDPFYESTLWGGRRTVNAWFVLLAPVAMIGFFASIRRKDRWTLLGTCALIELIFVTAVFHGYARYRFPYEPLLALWAAGGIGLIFDRLRSLRCIARHEHKQSISQDRRPEVKSHGCTSYGYGSSIFRNIAGVYDECGK